MNDGELVGASVLTPWGYADGLRGKKLHPSSGTPPAEVARNQRGRLFGAMFAVMADKGFEATTVADVVRLSGVSRSAFYEHFSNKAECLAAAATALIEPMIEELETIEGGEAKLKRFLELVDRQSTAARVCFLELHASGKDCEEASARGIAALGALLTPVDATAEKRGPAPELAPLLIRGLHKLIETRLCRDEPGNVAALAPDLWRWLASVVAPPAPLVPRRGRTEAKESFEGYTPAERITLAVARVVGDRGYLAMSTDDIAARAAISLSTFYGHFTDKRDASLAALEMGGAQIMALAGPAARRAADWQQGVRVLYEAICAYFTAEPGMARLATREIYGLGPRALLRRDRVINALAAMLAPGYEENPDISPIMAEAAAATGYAVIAEQVRRQGTESMVAIVPLATYVTLVGFVGAERACEVANGRG